VARIGLISDTHGPLRPEALALSETEWLPVGEVLIYTLHDLTELGLDPAAAGIRVVVSGHSHQPLVEERDGVLYVSRGGSSCRSRWRS
jgi:uncharacterized protein